MKKFKKILSIVVLLLCTITLTSCAFKNVRKERCKVISDYMDHAFTESDRKTMCATKKCSTKYKNGTYIVNFITIENPEFIRAMKVGIDSGDLTIDDINWDSREEKYHELYYITEQYLKKEKDDSKIIINVKTSDDSICICKIKNNEIYDCIYYD